MCTLLKNHQAGMCLIKKVLAIRLYFCPISVHFCYPVNKKTKNKLKANKKTTQNTSKQINKEKKKMFHLFQKKNKEETTKASVRPQVMSRNSLQGKMPIKPQRFLTITLDTGNKHRTLMVTFMRVRAGRIPSSFEPLEVSCFDRYAVLSETSM